MNITERFHDERDWFFEKRFGLFLHWGLYAVPAWHEQIQWRRNIPRTEYEKLIERFNPVEFDPDGWLDLAEEAGMGYVCLTTKHHDGFCLWDTDCTDFNVTNTPYGRDVVGMLAKACHRRGVPLCLYYSIADWNHPNYPNRGRHHELPSPQPGDEADLPRYLEFLKSQVRELCTNYGKISGFWWDMNVSRHQDPSVNAMIRDLQPAAVINDRGFDDGDFGTPERGVPEGQGFDRPTEACQSVGVHSWGYKQDEDYFDPRHLMASIDRIMARGGNYLLNVGPKADGNIGERSTAILRRIGRWYRKVEESFDATPASNLTGNDEVLLTQAGSTIYLHLPAPPRADGVTLDGFGAQPHKAVLLNTGDEVETRVDRGARLWQSPPYLRLRNLPVDELRDEVMVVRLEFAGGHLEVLPRDRTGV